jgi:hypothetical protein
MKQGRATIHTSPRLPGDVLAQLLRAFLRSLSGIGRFRLERTDIGVAQVEVLLQLLGLLEERVGDLDILFHDGAVLHGV